jgi:hypothetical protein
MHGEKTLQYLRKEYYLEDIMNPNAIKDRHRCHRCMVLWNFGDLFLCEDTGLYHVCNDSCKQLMILDEYRAVCGVTYRTYGLTSREIDAVQAFLHKEWLQKIKESWDKLIVMCDSKKNINLEDQPIEKLGVETHANCKLEHEDQDSIHRDNQDPISNDYTFEQEIQDSTHQNNQDSIDKNFILEQEDQDSIHLDDQNSTHHEDQDLLNILPHSIQYETSIINSLQETSYKDPFQIVCHSSSLHSSMIVHENQFIWRQLSFETGQTSLGIILLWPRRPPPKPNLLIVHFLWARRPPPKSNIFIVHLFFFFFLG